MKYFPLVWAGLWRKPTRTILTLLSIIVAFVLFGMLHGVTAGFDAGIEQMSETRLRSQSRINLLNGLPLAHLMRMEQVAGVKRVAYLTVFPAYYQQPTSPIPAAALSMRRFFDIFPDVKVSDSVRAAMLSNRTGALVGKDLATRHGWQPGDKVTLASTFWAQENGSKDWTFEIAGLYRFKDDALPSNEFWIHYDYLDEARTLRKGTVTLYLIGIDDVRESGRIAEEIDQEFVNSANPTSTQSEKEWLRGRIEELGNIEFFVNAIIGAVLFTLLFLTGNTMMQSVRERIPELAVLKTYGFSNATVILLMFSEALILCLSAALIGLAIAAGVFPSIFSAMGIGAVPMPPDVIYLGLGIAVLLAVVSTTPPAWLAQRLNIVDALAAR